MRCDAAQLALSEAMDDRRAVAGEAEAHATGCPVCAPFRRGAWRLRELTRFEVAPDVPDLVPAIMARARAETDRGRRPVLAGLRPPIRRRGLPGFGRRPRWAGLQVAAALLSGFLVGVVLTAGGVIPRPTADTSALAAEIPRNLQAAARTLSGYRATFDVTELDWTRAVPRRTFVAGLSFRAPESFRVDVRDTTRYPSAAWPRNDLRLVTDGRRWQASGPNPCPRNALPDCADTGVTVRTVTGRPPFDPSSIRPTDVIVPMTVLAAEDRLQVLGGGRVAGHDAVAVGMAYQDATPLFQYLTFLGSWRPFFPQDRVVLWLDHDTWFPLRYEVLPAAGRERSLWASGAGLPVERPDEPVFTAEAVALSTDPEPAPGTFRVGPGAGELDERFRDGPVPDAGSMTPAWTAGLAVWRTGRFEPAAGREFGRSVMAFARGLSWFTVTRVSGWTEARPFGVGPFAEPVAMPTGVGYYEAASVTDPRRVALHTAGGELLVESNLSRADLLRVAGSLPVSGLPQPNSWRIHRWSGGVTEDGLTPAEGIAEARLPVLVPGYLPSGYRAAAAEVARAGTGDSLTVVFRRPAAQLDGVGLMLVQATGQTLPPPEEPQVEAVAIAPGLVGRWSPGRHLLEWVDAGVSRSLSAPALDLPTLLRVARSLRSAPR